VVDGNLWLTESFAHRLSHAPIAASGSVGLPLVMIRNMPGYRSRLGRSADGGFWPSLFAVRTHLCSLALPGRT
jgi:hypothetical protein